jgi:hypothetical protein
MVQLFQVRQFFLFLECAFIGFSFPFLFPAETRMCRHSMLSILRTLTLASWLH